MLGNIGSWRYLVPENKDLDPADIYRVWIKLVKGKVTSVRDTLVEEERTFIDGSGTDIHRNVIDKDYLSTKV